MSDSRNRARLVHDDELELLVQLACRTQRSVDEQAVLERVAGLVKLRKLAQETNTGSDLGHAGAVPSRRIRRHEDSLAALLRALSLRRRKRDGGDEPEEGCVTWREQAACRGADPELFFPERGEPTAPAKAICAGCEVRQECLAEAMSNPLDRMVGVWGGTSERQRRQLADRPARTECAWCRLPFLPSRRGRIYCSSSCTNASSTHRYRHGKAS